jgi:hypothetical protein
LLADKFSVAHKRHSIATFRARERKQDISPVLENHRWAAGLSNLKVAFVGYLRKRSESGKYGQVEKMADLVQETIWFKK